MMAAQFSLFEPPEPEPEFDWLDGLPDGAAPAPTSGARWYQTEALERILASLETNRSTLVVMATGLGKSYTFSLLARDWPGKVLVLAHRDELVDQGQAELERVTGEYVEIEKAEFYASQRARIVMGSVQTLVKRMERFAPGHFSLVIADEAHHYVAKSFRSVLDYFTGAKVAGFTATPDRGDEAALGQVFDDVSYLMDIEDGIDQGYLVPVHGRQVELTEINLEGVTKSAGDLAVGQLDEAMLKAVEGICRKTIELEPDRQGVVFLPGVKSAEYAMLKFNELRPGSAAFVSGMTDRDERKQIVRDFKAGRYQYLCNCQVATEGFDAPGASLIVLGRPTLSRQLYAQMLGRGTRVLPGIVDSLHGKAVSAERRSAISRSPKPDCMVLDFVGNSGKHSLCTPEDVLGGNYSPAEVEQAKKLAKEKPGCDVRSALNEARRILSELAKQTQAKVRAEVRAFDPFHALGIPVEDEVRYANRFGGRPATEGQMSALRLAGVPEDELSGMSKRAAGTLLDKFKERRAAGLATYKQMRQLKKFGLVEDNITFERASAALTYVSSKGWGKRGAVDPAALYGIVNHRKDQA